MDIAHWRDRIDELDGQLVELLNQRAEAALEIGRIKDTMDVPIYDPVREKQVLDHIASLSKGPLSIEAVRRIFAGIIDENRRLERDHSDVSENESATAEVPPAES